MTSVENSTARCSPAASGAADGGALRPDLPGERDHPPADRAALTDDTGKIDGSTARFGESCSTTRCSTPRRTRSLIEAWVTEYNTDRPHQSLGRATPAQRFLTNPVATTEAGIPLRLTSLTADRGGEDWVSRRVASNGVISVAWQQISVGKHRGGEVVDVHVSDRLLEIWSGNELIRSIARDNNTPVRKRRASRPNN